jgi:glycosyltransferase involved in cell wall biosynthesis
MQKKIKIAMVAACPFPVAQGSQVYIEQMCTALAQRGHQVHLVCYHFGTHHKPYDFTIHRIPRITGYSRFRAGPSLQKPFLDLLLTLKLWQVFKKEKIDIIHAHNYEAPLAGFIVRTVTGVPVIFNSHNVLSDELYTYFRLPFTKRLALSVAHFLDHFIPQKADFCITVSEESINFLIKRGVAPEKIAFIPPGIHCQNGKTSDPMQIRKTYNLGSHTLIIYTGNLDGYQNIELLFQAIKILSEATSKFTLLIVTTSDYTRYQKLAQEMSIDHHIVFFSHQTFDQTRELLSACDITVSPRTSWSGFPIKLLNYMAAGKAIVASEGSAKGIKHKYNGLVVKNGDSSGFAKAILQLIKQPELARTVGINARKSVIDTYSWDSIVNKLEGVYKKVLLHKTN